jgi:hypothetical protein
MGNGMYIIVFLTSLSISLVILSAANIFLVGGQLDPAIGAGGSMIVSLLYILFVVLLAGLSAVFSAALVQPMPNRVTGLIRGGVLALVVEVFISLGKYGAFPPSINLALFCLIVVIGGALAPRLTKSSK